MISETPLRQLGEAFVSEVSLNFRHRGLQQINKFQNSKMLCCLTAMLWYLVPAVLLYAALGLLVSAVWVLVPGVLLYSAICLWVRWRSKYLLPHLRQGENDARKPLRIGFFHPYCNAGGGGERVLWTAIRALQNSYPNVKCVVYTGDTDATGEDIIQRAKERFNIRLSKPVDFVFLNRRAWVEAEPYPYFTMLGQSIGSLVLGWEAMMKFVPDIFIDTMGYAFTIPLFKYIGGCSVACYVHYPTISTDMLERVSQRTGIYNNPSFISRSRVLSSLKLIYYRLFAYVYGVAGARSDVVMVNSTWTKNHILSLWKAYNRTFVVYPPCDTKEFSSMETTDKSQKKVQTIVSIAQFRPEKDHPLQIKAFHKFLQSVPYEKKNNYKLVVVGSSRNEGDAKRVAALRELCAELNLGNHVEFKLNVPFGILKQCLADATIGLHTMLDEHFGIGVVELMASGTVTLAHNSGGPKLDIVTEHCGMKTGFLANSVESYASAMKEIFSMSEDEKRSLVTNARESTERFSEANFEEGFLNAFLFVMDR